MHCDSQPMEKSEMRVTLAVVQMAVAFGAVDTNLARCAAAAGEAVAGGASIIVYPELCTTGYAFRNREEALDLAEEIPGRSVKYFSELASDLNIFLVVGLAEKKSYCLYNSAALIGPSGLIGIYRKLHLFAGEKLVFEPGDLGLPVFHLPWGRLGILICYDLRFFEVIRIYMLKGVDLICVPTNWLVSFDRIGFDDRGYAMQNYHAMTLANTNQVYLACANRIGAERSMTFFGRSMVVGPSGWPLVGPASGDGEEVLTVTLDLGESRRGKNRGNLNDIVKDRRIDVYDEMLGSAEKRHPF